MSAQPVDRHWYILVQGKRYGPYTYAALVEAAAKGVVTAQTSVWRLGWVKWHPARNVPGLVAEPSGDSEPPDEDDTAREDDTVDEDNIADEDDAANDDGDAARASKREDRTGDRPAISYRPNRGATPRQRHDEAPEDDNDPPLGRGAVNASTPGARREEADRPLHVRRDAPAEGSREMPRAGQAAAPHPPPVRDASVARPSAAAPHPSSVGDAPVARPPAAAPHPPSVGEAPVARPPAAAPHPPSVGEAAPDRETSPGGLRAVRGDAPDLATPVNDVGIAVMAARMRDRIAGEVPRPPQGWQTLAVRLLAAMLVGGTIWGLVASGTVVIVPPRWLDRLTKVTSVPASEPEVQPQPAARPQVFSQSAPGAPASPALDAPSAEMADSGLPAAVAAMPAVVALKRTHPAGFAKFKKRFDDIAANAKDDQLSALTRMALRKSVRQQLANSAGDVLFEITEVYLGYMQALQFSSPESCVALSDDSKGASLTVNLQKELPTLFAREMVVLERVASTDPATVIAPLSAEQARPFLDTIFSALRTQPVETELLGRNTLVPSEFLPYCRLVIAFYEDVVALPADRRIDLLRYLYANAAAEPEEDGHGK